MCRCRYRVNIHTSGSPSWLAVRMAALKPDLQVCLSWGLIAESFHSLQSHSVSLSSWASQAHAFHQPVCQRLSLLHHWSVPHVHTIRVFSPSEWGHPQCQAAQVAYWTWWWQCLAAWHCRSVWSLPCHFTADAGGLALSMAKSPWHGALHSTHKSCTHGHVLKERWHEDRIGSRSLNFFQAVFTRVVVESSQPIAAESVSPR